MQKNNIKSVEIGSEYSEQKIICESVAMSFIPLTRFEKKSYFS